MRALVIFCHPSQDSFGAALFDLTCRTLRSAGHDLRCHDLYREGFNPVLSLHEWNDQQRNPGPVAETEPQHIANLRWAEALIVIYPTWYYGLPAMLKGWLDRVWLPGVAFDLPLDGGPRIIPKLTHIRLFLGITTSGSPWIWLKWIRDPGRNLWRRGLKVLFKPGCAFHWEQLYSMDQKTQSDRQRFLDRIERRLKSFQDPP